MLDHDEMLPNAVARRAATDPDVVALQEADGDRALTWREYDAGNRHYASALRTLGVRPGDTVATIIPLRAEGIHVWLGLSLLGAVEVPMSPLVRGAMLARLVEVSQATIIVIGGEFLAGHGEEIAALPQIETVVVLGRSGTLPAVGAKRVVGGDDLLAAAPEPAGLLEPRYWDVATVVFTSGTTGGAKGVLLPWGHLWASAAAQNLGLDAGRGFYLPAPLYHYGARFAVQLAALAGAKLVTRQVFSTTDYWDDIRRFDVVGTYFLGPWASFLMNEPARPDDRDNPLRKAQMVPLIPRHAEFAARFGVEVFGGYGSSEVGSIMNTTCCGGAVANEGSVVETAAGVEVRLVDEHDIPVARGEVGELIVRNAEPWTMMLGYLGNPDAMVRAWRNGWLHSGDSFHQDDEGHYHFVDRAQDVIRRRGENIASVELEAVVLRHPAIAEVAAVGVPSPVGEQDVLLVVALRAGHAVTVEALAAALDVDLPKFMRPRYIDILDALPKTITQRVRKVELRERGVGPTAWDREVHQPTRAARRKAPA